ncbi:MAG: hypothetical protein ABI693_08585 [Bryobacteraceae bacterium]
MRLLALWVVLASAALGQRTALPASPAPTQAKVETSGRWRVVFEHDLDKESLVITDFQFPSERRGIACGYLTSQDRKPRAVIVITSNGGQTWEIQPVKSIPASMFFLDDSTGWMVTRDGLYQTLESGRSWRKVKTPDSIVRVYFLTPERGWAFGTKKSLYETSDGGKTWTAVPAAAVPAGKPENSIYLWMTFATPKSGMLVGVSRPQRRGMDGNLPAWLDPESFQGRPEWPASSLFLDTKDGGEHWTPTAASLFGTITRLRFGPGGGLALFEFRDRFDFPSEVMRLDVGGKSQSVFRRNNRAITDVWVGNDGSAYMAGFEPPGKSSALPIPGKVRILKSDQADRVLWTEMPVDYRASARRVFLASPTPDHVWAATDTGMILKLFPPK